MQFPLILALPCAHALSSLLVDTSSGLVQGAVDAVTPNVAQFLGVPYAEPPVGARRWLPALARGRSNGKILDATRFGPSCPQYASNKPNTWATDAPEFNIENKDYQAEDCLSANIWAPWQNTTSAGECSQLLPVVVWIHGGSFQTGGASSPYHNPSQWVERSQEHIVVAINYRINIFGWPNARGLRSDERNLGYLDQRLAVEWVRGNIHNFGGDANRITLWGHSAGAVAVDSYSFSYAHDPIVSGLILSSGTAQSNVTFPYSNFTLVAEHFHCEDHNATAELACMQNVPFSNITTFLEQRLNNGTTPSLSFTPVVDNRTSWTNHSTRALSGNLMKVPAIIGTTVNEWGPFLPYNQTYGPNQTLADQGTLKYFLCPSALTTRERFAGAHATTYRYLYGGNFSNIAPRWWQAAFHSADLPLVFGTHGIARSASTLFETAVSEQMQDYWLAFAKDPVGGLPASGWRGYAGNRDGESKLFGWGGEVVRPIADSELEAPCDGKVPNGKPKPPVS